MEDFRIIDDEGVECPRGVVGEIVAYGAGMMKGYYRDPELTAGVIWRDERGRTFIRSGDLGYLDDGGSLFLAGRSKEMIKSGGINIFARDLEEVFMRHPEVLEVAAVAAPHPKWIETPVLLAIREPGATVTEDELRAWGNEQLAKYQRVDRVEFRDEFPRALYGKIKRQDLRDEFWDGDGAARPAPVRPGT
jgi:acyl-CoA synthetase (AMP-forming)/AMP-acid ligase II